MVARRWLTIGIALTAVATMIGALTVLLVSPARFPAPAAAPEAQALLRTTAEQSPRTAPAPRWDARLGEYVGGPADGLAEDAVEPVQQAPVTAAPVAPLRDLVEADVVVTTTATLPAETVSQLRAATGVSTLTLVATGAVQVQGKAATAIGVDPSEFRAYTPRPTASSDPLWESLARGELAASFDMGQQLSLPLGATVGVAGQQTRPVRVGAFATVGLPKIDVAVSRERAESLGLAPDAGVVLSAPHADLQALRAKVTQIVGASAVVSLVHPPTLVPTSAAGSYLTNGQLATVLATATSRLGLPYVWGATGPNAFDCSGLTGYAFHAIGIELPRTAAEQMQTGPLISLAAARPGDLLFWANDPNAPGFADHEALYLGDNKMIVAPHTGDVVKIRDVYLTNFLGAVRVDPRAVRATGGARW
ncbi:MAG: C40 family peptidase [Actinomycetota bacterium]|nr:C40 family peptidase [Actinomycetota bacterium]